MKHLLYFFTALILSGMIASCGGKKKTNLTGTDTTKIALHNKDVNIAYTDTGKHDTTLLFVHGWAINKGYFKEQAKYFAGKYRVVAIDLAGYGESGKNRNDWTTTAFAGDVDSVISQLDLKKVILIGHSMSGDIVLQSAIDNPDRVIGLVGIDNFKNPGQPETEQSKKEYAAAIAQMKLHFRSVATGYFNQALFSKTTSPAVRKRVLADVAHTDSLIAIASMLPTDFKEIDKLKEANKKLYLINSDIQPVDSTWMAATKIPYKVYYIKGSGHFPMIEHPKEFNAALEGIIKEIKSPSAP